MLRTRRAICAANRLRARDRDRRPRAPIHERSFLTGRFVLRSGAQTSVYVDKYMFEADPELLRNIAETMLAMLPNDIDALGLELGGIPIATVPRGRRPREPRARGPSATRPTHHQRHNP